MGGIVAGPGRPGSSADWIRLRVDHPTQSVEGGFLDRFRQRGVRVAGAGDVLGCAAEFEDDGGLGYQLRGCGPEDVDAGLRAMGAEPVRDPLRCPYKPTPEVLAECLAAGKLLGERAVAAAAAV